MQEIITLENVDFFYDRTPVLRDISLKIRSGEFISIIGPNGGGKTTLLHLLLGFLSPTKGTVSVFGKPPEKSTSRIGYVPQLFAFDKLFPVSVFEVVLSGRLHRLSRYGRYSEQDEKMALRALEEVGLIEEKKRPIGELSGGQVQRALIARALAKEPEILFLDEPNSCIDPRGQTIIENILRVLKRKMTVVTVTHHPERIGSETDRILCIHGTLSVLDPGEICRHFSIGLYEKTPLQGACP